MDRLTITVEDDIGAAVRAAAAEAGMSVSRWVAEAAGHRLRQLRLRELLDDYQTEHGAFTDEELAKADRLLDGPSTGTDMRAS